MTKTIKGILIDTENFCVREVAVAGGDETCESIRELVRCELFDVVGYGENGDGIYVDDEGLLGTPTGYFHIIGAPMIMAGNGLILGCDRNGDTVDTTVDIEVIRKRVTFMIPRNGKMFAVTPTNVDVPEPEMSFVALD